MPEPNPHQTGPVSPTPISPTESNRALDPLQWMRELMTSVIAVVILLLAAFTLWYTFQAAGNIASDPAPQLKQAREDAFSRQKDVMLYALALFGTVTGYYLGRVPAEVNAKRAEQAADSAQKQLAKTQDKLTDTAASASVTSAQLGQAKEESNKIANNLKETKEVLRDVRQTLSTAPESAPATLRGAETFDVDLAARLQHARERIDRVLARVETE